MSVYERLPAGIRRLFRLPPSYDRAMRELDEELAFHVEAHVAALRARGLSDADARAAALHRLGSTEDLREFCGEMAQRREPGRRVRQWLDELRQDVHFAWRQVARAPGFTATIVLILGLGIGANTGVFSIVHHTLIAPLPFADGSRMVTLFSTSGGGKISITPSKELILAWQRQARTVEQILVYNDMEYALGDSTRGPTEKLSGAAIPPQAFAFIDVAPLLGRRILPSDTLADAPPVVLLGEGVWRRDFGAARDIVGRSVMLDGVVHAVIGIVPATFFMPFTDSRDAFVALRHGSAGRPTGIGKLRRGVAVTDANREIATLFPPESELNPYADPPRLSRQVDFVGRQNRQMILMLFGAVGLVLLIACANAGNLLLARAWSRQREFAVRTALGAGRRRIARQVLTESLLIALLAGLLGIAIAVLVLSGVRAAMPKDSIDLSAVRIERAVLLWSASISVAAGIVYGVAPALFAAGASAGESLKAGGRTAAGSGSGRRLRFGLVVGELGLSVVLLAGAGLLVRTLIALNHVDYGFDPRGMSSSFISLRSGALADPVARRAALSVVLENVKAIPGVRAALMTSSAAPSFGIGMGGLEIEGRATAPADSLKTLAVSSVPAEYFGFAGIPLKAGRLFTAPTVVSDQSDRDEVIVNEALAKRLWPSGNALGARVRRGKSQWATVVGIVGDVRLPGTERVHRLNLDLQYYTRMPLAPAAGALTVRSNVPPGTLLPALQAAVRRASPDIRFMQTEFADAELSKQSAPQRFVLTLIGAFAVLAVVLAAVGLHAVVAYAVSQRTREIGVRVALGAQPADVARLVLGEGLALGAGGVIVGVAGAVAATRTLRTFLYGVEPGDPLTLASVSVALLVIAVAASYAPARRASRVDPVDALRAD